MATHETAWTPADGAVRYTHGGEQVLLGDRVIVRGWLRRRPGIVNYVPGVSEQHEEMEHHALFWVGVAMDRGTFTGVLVDPDTGRVPLELQERGGMDGVAEVPAAPWP